MNAIDKVRDEMAKSKGGQITYLGEGVTALLGIHPEYASNIAAEGKTLKGCLDAIKKGAKGGVSDPATSTKSICAYYGIKVEDANRLAREVNMAMLGGAVPQTPAHVDDIDSWARRQTKEILMPQTKPEPKRDDFDLDALLGVL